MLKPITFVCLLPLLFCACQQGDSPPEGQSLGAVPLVKKSSEYRILVLGDSLTEGYQLNPRTAYPHLLQERLRAKFKNGDTQYTVINAGISGSTSAGALKRFEWHLKKPPQLLILALGANDALRGLDPKNTKANLKAVITKAKESKITVLLAGVISPQNYGLKYKRAFDRLYRELSQEMEVALFPFLLKGVAGVAKYNLSDGIHPNEEGHKVMTENLLPKLLELL